MGHELSLECHLVLDAQHNPAEAMCLLFDADERGVSLDIISFSALAC